MLYIAALLLLGVFSTTATPIVQCNDTKHCTIEFQLNSTTHHRAELILEAPQHQLTKFSFPGSPNEDIDAKLPAHQRRYQTKPGNGFWGTALIENDSVLVDAVFQVDFTAAMEFRNGQRVSTVANTPENDILQVSGSGNLRILATVDTTALAAKYGIVTPFFPGCFPRDEATHVLKVNVGVDFGFVQAATAGVVGQAAQLQSIQREIEHAFSVTKVIYRQQLNVNIDIVRIIVGSKSDVAPFYRSATDGTCIAVNTAAYELRDWIVLNKPTDAGHTMLLSPCFRIGTTGVAFLNSLCTTNSASVSVDSWLTVAHELGHAFGMNHKFQDDGLGGIMDYGNGQHNGVVQFHPEQYTEVCPFLTKVKNSGCVHFALSQQSCGDGVMTKEEECECIDRSMSCGACQQCKLPPNHKLECSSTQFVMRTSVSPDFVAAQEADLTDSNCCTADNKFASPRTFCGKDGSNVCAAHGACITVCTYSSGPGVCDLDASGCMGGCLYLNKCRFDLHVNGKNTQLPDGTKCLLTGGEGLCFNGACNAQADFGSLSRMPTLLPTFKPTSQPIATTAPTVTSVAPTTGTPTTITPTSKPTTTFPTKKPTKLPTAKPTKSPSVSKPTKSPSPAPTRKPTKPTTFKPSKSPSVSKPTKSPTTYPTKKPTKLPTARPTKR